MRIDIKVIPRSSQRKIVTVGKQLKVYVHESATDGKANDAVRRLCAEYFNVSKSGIKIIKGETSRTKIIEIMKN
ncbi:MAG: DUF167 domain-containing protein [Candidatus Omnitrophica bacterium]|nr:DUF167 domain-containing protein [Candidatus Omnitrophota bacterium]